MRYSWQLIEPDGTRLVKGAAAVRLLQLLRPTRWLGRACRPRPLTRLVGLLDHGVSLARPLLSHCVPKGPGPRRWP